MLAGWMREPDIIIRNTGRDYRGDFYSPFQYLYHLLWRLPGGGGMGDPDVACQL